MIGTNRDLVQMQQILDREISRLNRLAGGARDTERIETRLATMCRQRISVCAALVNRRIEAANKVVEFSRWVSGNGALTGPVGEPDRAKPLADTARPGGSRLEI
jgi:hypothetical protein